LALLLHFGVPPNFFTKLVCRKVENYWSRCIKDKKNSRLMIIQ
jgi:hypothetical protein